MDADDRPISPWARTIDRLYTVSLADNDDANAADMLPPKGDDESQYIKAAAMTTDIPLPEERAIGGPRRKRNNSLIPPELMNDNSEGGRERAALATVFGVREYTESKIFWERQVAAYNQPMGGDDDDGFVSLTSRSLLGSSIHQTPTPSTSKENRQHADASIATLVDSVFENVGTASSHLQQPASPKSNHAPPEFALPDIPEVSKFSDLFAETLAAAAPVPRNIERKPRPVSYSSSIFTNDPNSYHEFASIAPSVASERRGPYDIAPPLVFIGYPPAIFDLLTSDDDERIIIWGLDPQSISASMATTSAAGKKLPDSGNGGQRAALTTPSFASVQSVPATVKGFSSNITSSTVSATSSAELPKSRKARWSSQLIPEGFKLSKPSLPLRKNKHQRLLVRHASDGIDEKEKGSMLFKFGRRSSRRDKRIMDDDQVSVQSVDVPKVIEAATVEKLVEKLTNTLDYTFMTDFFLTYRTFISPTQLCKLLILRFRWGIAGDEEARRIVRIRTFVVMRHWLLNYFVHDFIPRRELRQILVDFLNELPRSPLIKQSPRDQRIVKSLKQVVRRLKKVYYLKSSESDRVQVIAPPPPTEDQERVEEMARAKLAQSPMRRKTAIVSNVNVSDRHHGNMAVQDTSSAPVVVIGSVRNAKSPANPIEKLRTSANTPVKRNTSNTSITRFGRNNKQDNEAVKASYIRRMETQKRAMSMDNGSSSPTSPSSPVSPRPGNNVSSQSSIYSENSLDSQLSAGTTDSEMSDEEYDEDEDEAEQPTDEQLAIRLERERRRREEEEELNRAEFFSPSGVSGSSLEKVLTSSSIQSGSDMTTKGDKKDEETVQHLAVSQPIEEAATVTARARQTMQSKHDMSGRVKRPSVRELSAMLNQQHEPTSMRSTRRVLPGRDTLVHPTEVHKPSNGQQPTVSHVAQQLRLEHTSQLSDSGTEEMPESPSRAQQQRGPVYLSQLARRSITSGVEESVMHIQEVETATEEDLSTTNRTAQPRMSVGSSEPALGSPPRSPQRIVELDLPRPQLRTMSSIPPSVAASRRASDLYPKSFILYYRSERMARQLCLLEAQVLLNIDWEEMVHCRWTKMPANDTSAGDGESTFTEDEEDMEDRGINYTRRTREMRLARGENHGGIEQVIKRFNDVCQWVASEIVHTRSLDERVKVVEKFIRLAQKCKLYCNFATLVQILLGLQSPAVSRLKKTWDRVGSNEMRILEQLSAFTSPMKNWKHIRDSMTQVAEEYGMSPVEVQIEMPGTNHHAFTKTKIKIPFGGCIPFLGIYLSDLVFNSEQPPYIRPSQNNQKIYQRNNRMTAITSPVLKQPLVNFRKHRITATVIKRVLTFQNLARRYSFERDDEVYFLCSELHSSNPETVRKLSYEIEPNETW